MSRIVYTTHDGGVTVNAPTPEFLGWLRGGGFWFGRTNDMDAWIERKIAQGKRRYGVEAYALALRDGGVTLKEAYALTRDYDCAHLGSGHELWTVADLPNRWFRDAWRRSHNGGPIAVDMAKARKIQLKRIKTAADRVKADLELIRWRERIRRAPSPEQLRQIWPRGLPHG